MWGEGSDYEGDMEDLEDMEDVEDMECMMTNCQPHLSRSLNTESDVPGTLKTWLMLMEEKIPAVSVSEVREWTVKARREKLAEITGLSGEIEGRGKEIRDQLTSCQEQPKVIRRLRRLDKAWRQVWLRCFEWQCLLEQTGTPDLEACSDSSSLSSDPMSSPVQLHSTPYPARQADNIDLRHRRTSEMEGKPEVHVKCIVRESRTCRTSKKSAERRQKNSFPKQEKNSEYEDISFNTSAFARDSENFVSQEEAYSEHVENISDFWDKEAYLSEYNYDEPIDVETAKKILNFGDDYRNFMDSHSETLISPRQPNMALRRRRSQKELNSLEEGSNSEDEFSQMFDQISECKLELKAFEEDLVLKKSAGYQLDNQSQSDAITKELHRGREKMNLLKNIIGRNKTNNTFVGRKLSREVRFLHNRGKELESKVKQYLEQEAMFQTLTSDSITLKKHLEKHRTEMENNKKFELAGDLRQYLTLLKKSMSDLSKFKSQLFDLNLGVHSLLGDLSNTAGGEDSTVRHGQVETLREEVVKLYAAWDMYNMGLNSGLTVAEENVNNVKKIEENISEFKKSLGREEAKLVGIKSRNLPSDDSGFSDSGSNRKMTRGKINNRKEHFERISFYVNNLFCSLPQDSPVVTDLNNALKDASSQLDNLSKAFNQSNGADQNSGHSTKWTRARRYCAFCIFFLSLIGVFSIFMRPDCCENRNSYNFYPKYSHVNGPPPI